MRMRRFFSVSLSIAVIVLQLSMPLSQALASLPEPSEGLPPPQPPPQLTDVRDPIVIPVVDDEGPPDGSTDSQPPREDTSPEAPLAAQQALTIPLGTGNHNYGQTQRDTDNPQNHPGHHFAGPVNLVNGNFFLTVGDFFIPGRGLSLQLARSYNSLAAAEGMTGTFGYGWTHSYETHVISETRGLTLTVQEADGALHNYTNPYPCPDTPAYTCYESPPGLYRQLRDMSGAGYLLLHKNGTMQQFGAEGQLVEIVDQNGNQINLYYNPSPFCTAPGPEGTLCQVVGPSGQRSLQFTYIEIPGIGTFIGEVAEMLPDGLGRTIVYNYEPTPGELTNVFYPDGAIASYGYDGQHQMASYDDPRQPAGVRQAEEIVYDAANRVISVTHSTAADSFFDITYQLAPEMGIEQGAVTAVEIADGANHRSRVEFDAHANPVFEGDYSPERGIWIGKWWIWHPWRWWLLRSKIDANYHTTTYGYNDWGQTNVVTTALGTVQRFLWEPPYYESLGSADTAYSNILSATNSLDVTTLYKYNYDPTGHVMTEIRAAGLPEESTSVYENDEWGQLVRQTEGADQVTLYEYDEFGNTTVVTDAMSNVTHNAFDAVGRPITTTDQAGNATTYVYDESDRLLSVTDPRGGTTEYTYSADGRDNLVQLVNANDITKTFAYDDLDRLITETNSLEQQTTYEYDPLNRLIARTGADGRVTEYEYDAKSRMTLAAYYDAGDMEPYQLNEYRYDPAGNLIWMQNDNVRLAYEYDELDQRTQIAMWTPTWGATRTLQLERDPESGNLHQITGPGGYLAQYEYDNLNRLQTVTDPEGSSTSYVYDQGGRLAHVVYPNGTASGYVYDELNHLTELSHTVGSEPISYTYGYDERGNIVRELDEGQPYTYTHDTAGQVASADGGLQGEVRYEYDLVGNRTMAHSEAGDTDFVYNDESKLLQVGDASFEYDAMGARIQAQQGGGTGQMASAFPGPLGATGNAQAAASTVSYQYDNDMRLTRVEPGLTLLYDPMGNLIGTLDEDGNYRYFLRDGADVYVELDGNGDVTAQYVRGGEGVLSMWRDGQRYLFLYDGRGRVRRVVNQATGQVAIWYGPDLYDPGYSPYGLVLYNPIRMRGGWWFPRLYLFHFGDGVFWDPRFGVFLVKAWPWLYWPFGPFHPWRPIFRFWPWPWPWPRPWGWPWPRPWPFLWPWPGAWVRPWIIWPFWPWGLRPWWPWWYWRWWWGWHWWGRWWCWHPWWWFCKWWWWPWWHPWWWWGYWWFPWWWWAPCWWWPWHWWWWIWWWPGWWPGWFFWWCWWWRWPWHWWWWPWGITWRGPPYLGPPEVGDAPDPPYHSYRRNNGAVHGIWWYEWLGARKDGEWDSEQVDADLYDDGVEVDLVARTLAFTPTVAYPWSARYGAWSPLHVHGWFDWNGDGDWLDRDEFVVNWTGYPGDGTWPAGQASFGVTQPFTIPQWVFNNGNVIDLWARFRLDYNANWQNPRGYTRFGEVEDHTFTAVRPIIPPWNGQLVLTLKGPLSLTYPKVVSGVQVSITPTVAITPVWSGGPSPLGVQGVAAGDYGDELTLEHEPFTPYETYTVSLSSGITYTGTEVVLPASFSFTAQPVTLTQIAIDGPSIGAPGTYTFTTSYEPITASEPITYLWDNGDTMSTSVRALNVGVHDLMVTATNPVNVMVTDTHTITITEACIEITGVDLQVITEGSLFIEDVIFFEADITPNTATKPYTYLLTLDGTPGTAMTDTADPLVFTQTFTISGPHTVDIDVWNCDMSASEAFTDTVDLTTYLLHNIYLPLVMRNS